MRARSRLARAVAALGLAVWPAIGTGCGGESGPAGDRFFVALLTPGSVSDGGWNQGAYEGLLRVRDELGAEVSHLETRSPAEFEEAFRGYARQGADLVFGHGFEYQEAAARAAEAFPDTVFVTTSGSTVRPNLAPMVFALEEATWLCGWLAARLSETGQLGLVGGIDLPSIRSTFLAFRAGARAADPEVGIREVFTGNFSDVSAAREAALALLEEGADMLLHQANDAGRGVFRAVSDWSDRGHRAFAFGTNRNQNAMAPDVVLASATLRIPEAFAQVAGAVRAGGFEPRPIRLGMAEGIVALEPNPALADRIPAPVRARLAELEAEIRAGGRNVPRVEF